MADDLKLDLDLVQQYENPEKKNIRNAKYDATHTAQGYYQLTNTNWRFYGPKVGIDTKKYPNAMSASEEDQRKVASHLLYNTPLGIRNWSDNNPQLAAAIKSGKSFLSFSDVVNKFRREHTSQEKEIPTDIPFSQSRDPLTPPKGTNFEYWNVKPIPQLTDQKPAAQKSVAQNDYDNMSLEDLQKLSKQMHQQLDALKGSSIPDSKGAVEPPPSSRIGRWAESGFGTIPAYHDVKRAFTDPDWRDKASDVIEAGGEMGPAFLTGSLMAAPFTGGMSALGTTALRAGLGYGGSLLASQIADSLGGMANLDPKTRRLLTDIAGLGGGIAGYEGTIPKAGVRGAYRAGTSPYVGAAAGGTMAHGTGVPWWMGAGVGRALIPEFVRGMTPEFIKRWAGIEDKAGKAPTGEVKPPLSIKDIDNMFESGAYSEQDYLKDLKMHGVTDTQAQGKLNEIKTRVARESAEKIDKANQEAAKEQQRRKERQQDKDEKAAAQFKKEVGTPQGSPVTILPSEGTNPSGQQIRVGNVTVGTPPNVRAVTNQPITGTMGPQLTPNLPVSAPPAPGSQGTVGPLGPMQQGPPLEGSAATGTPISPSLGQPPIQPQNLSGTRPDLGNVRFGQTQPSPPLPGLPETRTPLGRMPMSEEDAVQAIVKAALGKMDIPKGKLSTDRALVKASKKLDLDFIGTKSQFARAMEILKSIFDAEKRTTSMPGKEP